MNKSQRQKYLAIVEEKVKGDIEGNVKSHPGFTICDLCRYLSKEWDGDDYRLYWYPVCNHPLSALSENDENMPAYRQQDGAVEDCWGFRPKRKRLIDLDELVAEIGEWANKTFKRTGTETDFAAVFNHLEREIAEFRETRYSEEAAGVAMLLFHLCHMEGISLYMAIKDKFAENQGRKWSAPDEFGVIEHIKGA